MNAAATLPNAARITRKILGRATSDGAGVKLTRVIGGPELPELDPFLLLDEFGTDRAEDYIAGFPSHPHRGFETVTYMLDGRMRHKDNHGNEGLLTPGSVQWMTAGRGLVHSEMPEQESGRMRGFQLWVNLPARDKMTEPKYQEFAADFIPVLTPAQGVEVKVIAGVVGEAVGPIRQPATDPLYLDISLQAGTAWQYNLPQGHNAFAYVFEGAVSVGEAEDARSLDRQEMAVLGGGERLRLQAGEQPARLILVAGRPLGEPVMRHGPFVMNTRQELMQAFVDFQEGRF
ncbi:MAG: pirin family protein [Pseudoxanthomonas sp.]